MLASLDPGMYSDDETKSCTEPEPCGVIDQPVEHILIIDDDTAQSDVLAYRFAKQGYRVTIANTSTDGVIAAKSDSPDVILLDIRLPDANGLDVCSELTDEEATAGIPIIIVSGMDGYDVVRLARAAGCHYYVRKPYDPNVLLVLTQNAIAESQDW